jgi:tetratricopeptide (TPR) repeat protein
LGIDCADAQRHIGAEPGAVYVRRLIAHDPSSTPSAPPARERAADGPRETAVLTQPTAPRTGRVALASLAALLTVSCASEAERPVTEAANSRIIATAQPVGEAAAADDGTAYGAYLAGLYANSQRDLSAAARYMSRALAADPNNPRLLHNTFMLVAGEGQMDRARSLAQRVLQINPGHGPARVLLAVEALRDAEFASAARQLDELPAQGLAALVRPLLAAWIQVGLGDTDAALEKLRGLEPMDGFGALRQAHIALVNDLAGRGEAAAEAYDKIEAARAAQSLRLAWLLGNFHARNGEIERARAVYRAYMTRNPESAVMEIALDRLSDGAPEPLVSTAGEGAAEALFNLAGLLNQEGASDLALVYDRMALRLRPDFPIGKILLGEVLAAQNRTEPAAEVYRGVPAESPYHYIAQLRLAEGLDALGRSDRAVEILEAQAAAFPERFEPLYQLGNLYRSDERFDEAEDAYARALARIPEPQTRHWTVLYFRGIALERTDRWEQAERHFKQALELQPEQPYVMNYLAYSWVEQKQNLAQAQEMLRRAVELRPEDGYIVDSLGWVYYRLGKYEKAVEKLERAVELRPADPTINDHLGDAYWKVGRRQEARFQWERALALDPDSEEVAPIEAKLENGLPAGDNG